MDYQDIQPLKLGQIWGFYVHTFIDLRKDIFLGGDKFPSYASGSAETNNSSSKWLLGEIRKELGVHYDNCFLSPN